MGLYEVLPDGRALNYIPTPNGIGAVVVTRGSLVKEIYYLYRDHLGSLIAVENQSGTMYSEFSYDPWGRRRNPDDWSDYANVEDDDLFIRGFTGHVQ